jgi:hypothetical protein
LAGINKDRVLFLILSSSKEGINEEPEHETIGFLSAEV